MFIIDFDDTLFSTHAFKKARFESLQKLGVSEEEQVETYREARNSSDGLFTYSNQRHADALERRGFDGVTVMTALEETTGDRLKTFLFPDTIDFLERIKGIGEPMVLLSLGDPSFQELKVVGSGVAPYFDRRFMVQESKVHIIQELLDVGEKEEEMWFINDKVGETLLIKEKFPQLHIVLKKSGSIPEEEYNKSNLNYFETLTQVYEYIAQNK